MRMITVTPKAAEKVKGLLSQDGSIFLRMFVKGGGCSGFEYGMSIEETKNDTDNEFESEGIKIIVDPISIRYLDGSEIYWDEKSMLGGQFGIKNPNAKGTCGCGQSFEPR